MKGISANSIRCPLRRMIWLAIMLLCSPAYAQDDFKNRWWPNGEPIPTSVSPAQSTTTTTITTPYQTMTTTTTMPLVCCEQTTPVTPPVVTVPPHAPRTELPKTELPATTMPTMPPVQPLDITPPQKEARAAQPVQPAPPTGQYAPPVLQQPPPIVRQQRPRYQRQYVPQYYYDDCCRSNRLQDLSVPADRVNRGTPGCNGVACYP